ncbi:hypothetical protein BT63DRAFT_456186 [Microthyrium microscopicum]|uniref:Uncharacterized protein n=1 Tax=Microthyrium microscopicum TaxID=703497 RepID=A0A6A6UAB9_9PEZI|nr:hypothetical protein BT63DRAFT_456186 [Microthyrium microscopicum]
MPRLPAARRPKSPDLATLEFIEAAHLEQFEKAPEVLQATYPDLFLRKHFLKDYELDKTITPNPIAIPNLNILACKELEKLAETIPDLSTYHVPYQREGVFAIGWEKQKVIEVANEAARPAKVERSEKASAEAAELRKLRQFYKDHHEHHQSNVVTKAKTSAKDLLIMAKSIAIAQTLNDPEAINSYVGSYVLERTSDRPSDKPSGELTLDVHSTDSAVLTGTFKFRDDQLRPVTMLMAFSESDLEKYRNPQHPEYDNQAPGGTKDAGQDELATNTTERELENSESRKRKRIQNGTDSPRKCWRQNFFPERPKRTLLHMIWYPHPLGKDDMTEKHGSFIFSTATATFEAEIDRRAVGKSKDYLFKGWRVDTQAGATIFGT